MAFVGLILLTVMMPQTQTQTGILSPESRIRADAVFQRAWQGRRDAVQRLCGEQSRLTRVRALDVRFARAQQTYQKIFGATWEGQSLVSESRIGVNRTMSKGVLSDQGNVDPKCVSVTAFAGALGEYQNGIMLAEGELGIR